MRAKEISVFRKKAKSLIYLLLLLSITNSCTKPSRKELVLFDFNHDFDSSQVVSMDGTFELIEYNGLKALKVINGFTEHESGVKLFQSENKTWDLKPYCTVLADVKNTGDEFIQVEMFVGNDPDGLKRWYCSDYIDLEPGESGTIRVNLAWTPWIFKPQPEILGMRGVPGMLKTDIEAIQEITFNSRYSTTNNEFIVKSVRAVNPLEQRDTAGIFPFVDEFGQYIHSNWKRKTRNLEELKSSVKQDLQDLKNNPNPAYRNKYGGWTAGPKLEATGFFRTEKYHNKWWMVDPEGNLFWSAGINCVGTGQANTGVEYREKYFLFLPDQNDILAQFYDQSNWASHGFYKDKAPYKTFNFYNANLYRKYGEDWHNRFSETTHRRLNSWGINTIGFMSDRKTIQQHKTPYTGSIWISGTPKIEGSEGFWGKFHDVFDPGFRETVRTSIEGQKQGAGDPWCIGFFIDNEMSWGLVGSLAIGALKSPASQAAKIEFISDLKKKYKSIDALNKAWNTHHASWREILETTTPPDLDLAKEDLNTFYQKIAQTYFRTIKEELNSVAPNQCYLGCRFAWANNEITIGSAAEYCEIISFNKYEYSVGKVGLPKGIDKPILIGEFHFGATDEGSFHPGVKIAQNQADRGLKYQAYIQGALRNPYLVGAHWFQYTDQPNTGRGDGENYNVGFVDICDRPFTEFIDKVRETTWGMYEYRIAN